LRLDRLAGENEPRTYAPHAGRTNAPGACRGCRSEPPKGRGMTGALFLLLAFAGKIGDG
jgi:hypothetical protein